MKLTAFKFGETEITGNMEFQQGDKNRKIPIALLFFLIESGEKKILVDVGCDTMPGFPLFKFQKPAEVLESYGITADDITDVIITHAHHDHIDALRYYSNATVHIHKNELKSAERYLPEGCRVCAIEKDKLITDNIEFKHVGGHSSGSGIVLVKNDDKVFVLCGDECYTKENLLQKKLTGASFSFEKSQWFVEEYSKPVYTPILSHDPDIVPNIGYATIR